MITLEIKEKIDSIFSQLEDLSGRVRTANRKQLAALHAPADKLLSELSSLIIAQVRPELATRLLQLNVLVFSQGSKSITDFLYPPQ